MQEVKEEVLVLVAGEPKVSQGKKVYWSVRTGDNQAYTIFEEDIWKFVESNYNKPISCQIATNEEKGWKNIRGAKEITPQVLGSEAVKSQIIYGEPLIKPNTTDMTGKDNPYKPKTIVMNKAGTYHKSVNDRYVIPKQEDKHKTMYVSYVKDIFVAMRGEEKNPDNYEDTMKQAIKMVKQARDSF